MQVEMNLCKEQLQEKVTECARLQGEKTKLEFELAQRRRTSAVRITCMCLKIETSRGKIYRSAKFCACMLPHLLWSFHAALLVFQSYFLFRKLSYFQMESDISHQEIIKTLQTQLTNAREDLQQKVFPIHM